MIRIDSLIAAVNGAFGDRLERDRNPLAITLAFRRHGRTLALTPQALAGAYPGAGSRLALFIHGLCCDETRWRQDEPANPAAASQAYGPRLEAALGITPLYVRYNSGRHISDTGEALAHALNTLVRHWPVPVTRIALIGHSMGGLVARSASHHALAERMPWPDKVSEVICLGTPHHGAPLEKVSHLASALLGAIDITRPLATAINSRSAGIKDLRHGSLRKADWHALDADALLGDRRQPVLPLPQARYHFIGATLGNRSDDLRGILLGDGLVRAGSASGRHRDARRRVPFADGDGHILCKLHHMQLLDHPQVYAHLERWLAAAGQRS